MFKTEQETLEKEQEMLTNAAEIKEALATATEALSGDDVSTLTLLRFARTAGLAKILRVAFRKPSSSRNVLKHRSLISMTYHSEAEKLNDRTVADPGRLEICNTAA
ncbi:MAG: hypothetical protein U5L72_17975 [Bacteroidales bacterium]|nr:hypothetical protein [Bacteroidales bacterium]